MALAIVPPPVKAVDAALVREISDLEGIGIRAAAVLAALYGDELLAYADAWDAQQPRCPQCGATLEPRQYYAGGRGYRFVEVCSGDASHYSREVQS